MWREDNSRSASTTPSTEIEVLKLRLDTRYIYLSYHLPPIIMHVYTYITVIADIY